MPSLLVWWVAAEGVLALLAALLVLAGCASFPDGGPHDWRDKIEGVGELGGPPAAARPPTQEPPPPPDPAESGAPRAPSGCVDPDPQVVATCLAPVGAIAVLPDGRVGARGRARHRAGAAGAAGRRPGARHHDPGGRRPGAAGSPGSCSRPRTPRTSSSTPTSPRRPTTGWSSWPRVSRPSRCSSGSRGAPQHNAGALGVDADGLLLVATGDSGEDSALPGSLAGKVLRIDTLGRPGTGNPDPRVARAEHAAWRNPAGLCVDGTTALAWVPDRTDDGDTLHLVAPGALPAPAWRWPDRPGVAGCAAHDGVVTVAQTFGSATYVLRGRPQRALHRPAPDAAEGGLRAARPGRHRARTASCGWAR